MGSMLGRNMEIHLAWINKTVKTMMLMGAVSALSVWAQPEIPTTPDAPCAAEPAAGAADTVVSTPDGEGYLSLFDGTFKGWWQSCATVHSSGSTVGGIFKIGSDAGTPAIYTNDRDNNIGGLLMTKKTFTNYELVFDFWPDFGNDGGVFNRTPADGKCFQTVLDYIQSASVGGTWMENRQPSRDIRPWKYLTNENSIEIPAGNDSWTSLTSKLTPAAYGCAASGCVQADYLRLWDVNGWNQIKLQFYGGSATGKGNIHMKTWFRKAGATVWVPIIQDTTLALVIPAGYIGFQIHNGNRFSGPKGTWYKNIKWKALNDVGEPLVPTSSPIVVQPKFAYKVNATGSALVGNIEKDFEIVVKDLSGKTVESFKGSAGNFSHLLKTQTHGWLNLQIKTSSGVEHISVLRSLD
jgi:hypothetical protein